MKTKFLLSAVALTATFAACNNEEAPSSVDKNLPVNEEVVGATLVSEGGAISLGDIESRVNADGWEPADKLALAWYNLNSEGIGGDQLIGDWNDNKENGDPNIYANHLFTRTEDGKFVTNSNIYQGAHFIYFPYAYSSKIGQMTVNVNEAVQEAEFSKDALNKALYVSAQDFITEEDLDKESGKLEKKFYITPAVNALKVNVTPETGISSNSFLKNLEISKLDIWNQEALFNPTATIDPNKVPMVQFDEYGEIDTEETFENLKDNLADAFKATPAANLITNIDADITLANASSLRAFTLPTVTTTKTATWTAFNVYVVANGETESYPVGHFQIELPTTNEANVKTLKKLQAALYTTPDPDVDAYYLQQNMNDKSSLAKLNLDVDLLAADFIPDWNISNLEEWNLTVAMVNALNTVKEAQLKPTFTLTGKVCVTEGKTIDVPTYGVNVVATGDNKVCFETDYTVNAALANVFDNTNAVYVKTGAALTISDNVTLNADLENDGIINVGYKASLGATTPNVDNTNGRINVVYGSYVNAESGKFGTIAYEVAAEEYAYRINNLLATSGNVLGHAKVNTLVIGKDVTLNVAKKDANTPERDPYEGGAATGETIDQTLLAATDVELVGGTLEANIAKKTVNNVKVLASTTASTIKDIHVNGDLAVQKGATISFDATPDALGLKSATTVKGDIKNEGVLNVSVSIRTTNVYNEVKNQSVLSVLGDEVVWYTEEYYQGGMAQGDILRKATASASVTEAANVFEIKTAADLLWVAEQVNVASENFSGKTIKLMNDIDLAGIDWTPIGNDDQHWFRGSFDGNNKTIKNLNVNKEGLYAGLFGRMYSAESEQSIVKNLTIDGAVVKGNHCAGVLAGQIDGYEVKNVIVKNAIVSCTRLESSLVGNSYEHDGDKAGAILGLLDANRNDNYVLPSKLTNCKAENSQVSAGRDAGQILGSCGVSRKNNLTDITATNVVVSANGTSTGANIKNEFIGRIVQ